MTVNIRDLSNTRLTSVPEISLRSIDKVDLEFLLTVYALTRAEEMNLISDWPPAQQQAFLRSQFQTQHAYYQSNFPRAHYDIVVLDQLDIGRFYVERLENEIRIMDIALLPEYRNRHIGGGLIREVLEEALQESKRVSLHVEETNPAKGLYERMGFAVVGEVSFYQLMQWEQNK